MIYTVTVLGHRREDIESGNKLTTENMRSRCWGYFLDAETAEKSVRENWTDMFEDRWYQYAVVEALPEGIGSVAEEISWWRAYYPNGIDGGPCAGVIERPDFAEGIAGWSIG